MGYGGELVIQLLLSWCPKLRSPAQQRPDNMLTSVAHADFCMLAAVLLRCSMLPGAQYCLGCRCGEARHWARHCPNKSASSSGRTSGQAGTAAQGGTSNVHTLQVRARLTMIGAGRCWQAYVVQLSSSRGMCAQDVTGEAGSVPAAARKEFPCFKCGEA